MKLSFYFFHTASLMLYLHALSLFLDLISQTFRAAFPLVREPENQQEGAAKSYADSALIHFL
jgi:hypothetical protein